MSDKIRYHINPETGRPGVCSAQIKCEFAVDGAEPEHYDSIEEAFVAYEKQQEANTVPNVTKKAKKEEALDAEIVDDGDDDEVVILGMEEFGINAETSSQSISEQYAETATASKPSTAMEIAPTVEYEDPAEGRLPAISDKKKNEIETRTDKWVSTISSIDPSDQEFTNHAAAISKIGSEAFKNTAQISNSFLKSNDAAGFRGDKDKTTAEISKSLVEARTVLERMVPKENDLAQKALSFIPGRNAIKAYFNRFQDSSKQLSVIFESLEKGQANLVQENIKIDQEIQAMGKDLRALQNSSQTLAYMDEKIVGEIRKAEMEGDTRKATALSTEVLNKIRTRRMDVATQGAVTKQSIMAFAIVKKNNETLSENVERTINTTGTAMATTKRVADALGEQKKVLEGVNAMRSATEKAMLLNAEMLRDNSAQINQQANQAAISPEVLQKSYDAIFESIDTIQESQLKSNENLSHAIEQIEAQGERARQRMADRQGLQINGTSNNTTNLLGE